MIDVAEIYTAPQGEGPTLGRPSLFVRVRGCPLACRWCDSKFTWTSSKEEPEELFEVRGNGCLGKLVPEALAHKMLAVARQQPQFPPAVVFTGGEPLIYQRELPAVITAYRARAPLVTTVEVETAGTIAPSAKLLRACNFNVSPKLQSAGNDRVPMTTLWNWKATQAYLLVSANNVFKIVVARDDEESLSAYLSWLRDCAADLGINWALTRSRVYLMPAATTAEQLVAAQARVIDLATQHGVNVTTRLQILAYGNERGR